jgi:flagellar biosynthesis protein FliP
MLTAVRPVVVGLLVWTAFDMAATVFAAKRLGWSAALTQGWDKLALTVASFVLLTFTSLNPAVVVLGAAALGLLLYR